MNPYNMMIKLGRAVLDNGLKVEDHLQEVFNYFSVMSDLMEGESVEEFFTVFPPIKRYVDDGSWNYDSSLKRKNNLGKTFTRESFQHLLMTSCYENKFLCALGLSFMRCISELYKRENNRSLMEEWAIQNDITVYEKRNGDFLPKLYLVK